MRDILELAFLGVLGVGTIILLITSIVKNLGKNDDEI
jgi:hypothetical protein